MVVGFKLIAYVIAGIMTFKSQISYALEYGPSPGEGVATYIEGYNTV
jgi:hypothetical protein